MLKDQVLYKPKSFARAGTQFHSPINGSKATHSVLRPSWLIRKDFHFYFLVQHFLFPSQALISIVLAQIYLDLWGIILFFAEYKRSFKLHEASINVGFWSFTSICEIKDGVNLNAITGSPLSLPNHHYQPGITLLLAMDKVLRCLSFCFGPMICTYCRCMVVLCRIISLCDQAMQAHPSLSWWPGAELFFCKQICNLYSFKCNVQISA